jgi:hypothetical protein
MTQRIDLEKVAQVALAYALTKAAVGAAPGNNFNWQHALMGAGLGAGAGALSGLVAPGKDDEDETDRTGSAVMRALLAGGLGGLAGGYGGKYITPYLSGAAEQPLPRIPDLQKAIGRAPLNIERSPGAALERLSAPSAGLSPEKPIGELPLQRAKAPVYSDRLPAFNERNV